MDRRMRWALIAILAVVVAAGIGFGAYNLGLDENVTVAVAETTADGTVVVADHPRRGGGFFPFGFIFPLLFLFLLFGLFRAAWWGGRGRGWGYGPPDHPGQPPYWEHRLDEWHRRSHETADGGDQNVVT